MTLPIPQLDDLAWPELVGESRDLLPSVAPTWTDHNIHDPGITIIELLAWLTEHTCYRLDRIPERHRRRFLSLLGHADADTGSTDPTDLIAASARALHAHEELVRLALTHDVESLDDIDRELVRATAAPARAVNVLDIERLALATPGDEVERVRAFPGLDLAVPCWRAPGTVSVIVLPDAPADRPEPSGELLVAVDRQLRRHKIVGTRIRVHGPHYTPVSIAVEIAVRDGTDPMRAVAGVDRAIRTFLHPLRGGPAGLGWPFGRDVYRTEILALATEAPGVDLATSVQLSGGEAPDSTTCANLCVPAVDLVDLVDLHVEVAR